MKRFGRFVCSALALGLVSGKASAQTALGTAFTYQGQLKQSGSPANGNFTMTFKLFDAATAGNQIGPTLTFDGAGGNPPQVSVTSGLFTVQLDFGGVYQGDKRWLEMSVSGTTLAPRPPLTPAPYALALPGVRVQQNPNGPSVIGGFSGNFVSPTAYSATIGGGGENGDPNRALAFFDTVSGGSGNTASGGRSTVCGGLSNTASGSLSTVAGGRANQAGGDFSLAAGRRAKVRDYLQVGGGNLTGDQGTFVWADSTDADFTSTGPNQYLIRASGGVGIGTNSPQAALDVAGTAQVTGFRLPTGAGIGMVLTSDATGAGTWQAAPSTGWSLTGNAGTTPGTNFLGTTDVQALELKVNGSRALRLEPDSFSPNVIGGYSGNTVTVGVHGATIAGGGQSGVVNQVTDVFGIVGGGISNTAGNNNGDPYDSQFATVSGGLFNIASGAKATIAGGAGNVASGPYAMICGGENNAVSGDHATVSGGTNNAASGFASAVAGGYLNSAGGDYSFAVGYRANVRTAAQVGGGDTDGDQGTFVWADSTSASFQSTGPNQFLIRANGGVGIGTNSPGKALQVGDRNTTGSEGMIRLASHTTSANSILREWDLGVPQTGDTITSEGYSFVVRDHTLNSAAPQFMIKFGTGNVGIGTNAPSQALHVVGNICATGTIGACSDARFKEHVEPVAGALDKLSQLRGVTFDWKRDKFADHQFAEGPQVGFIAQEVEKVLPQVVAKGSDGYLSVDYGRVTPLLVEAVKEQQSQVEFLRAENAGLQARLERLEALLISPTQQTTGGAR